jgi:hypothetical protein
VLRHFDHQVPFLAADGRVREAQRVVDRRQRTVGELDVDDRTDDLCDFAHAHDECPLQF